MCYTPEYAAGSETLQKKNGKKYVLIRMKSELVSEKEEEKAVKKKMEKKEMEKEEEKKK